MHPAPAPRLYRRKEAANFLGISEDRLARLAVEGKGPAFHKPAGARVCIYSEQALLDWLGESFTSTTQVKARDRELAAA